MSEFSFIDNVGWLKPFIIELHKHYKSSTSTTLSIERITSLLEESEEDLNMAPQSSTDKENVITPLPLSDKADIADSIIFTNTPLSFDDATEFAIHNLNSIFRNDCFTIFNEKHSWVNCLDNKNYNTKTMGRISRGFGKRYVPIGKKFNPKFHNTKYHDMITLAEYSYNYLVHRNEIDMILKTPSSDYTRFGIDNNENIFNRFFILNLRHIQKINNTKGPFEHILSTYNSKVQIM
jgi:hypothetical protein